MIQLFFQLLFELREVSEFEAIDGTCANWTLFKHQHNSCVVVKVSSILTFPLELSDICDAHFERELVFVVIFLTTKILKSKFF